MLRPATNRSTKSIAMNALEKRPLPIAFGGPGAVTVAGTRQSQARRYRPGSPPAPARSPASPAARDMIAQQRERRPALRAADPPPGKSQTALNRADASNPAAPPGPPGRACRPCRRPGPAPRHRRPHPHGQQAPASPAPTTSRTPSAVKPPGKRATGPTQPPAPRSPPEAGVLLAQITRQPRQILVRLQRRSQHILRRRLSIRQIQDNTCRNRHAAQQTPSLAANHAPRPPCRTTARPANGLALSRAASLRPAETAT